MSNVKSLIISLVLILGLMASPASAQITVPNTFAGTMLQSDVNENFSSIAGSALNRANGTITGNITVNGGVTIDGVDVGALLGGTGTPTFDTVTITGTGAALTVTNRVAINSTAANALDVAGGITVGTGNVALVDTTGKIPALTTAYFTTLPSFTSVAYDTANYTSDVGTWVPSGAGNQTTYTYWVVGKMMFVAWVNAAATVTGTPAYLKLAIPGGFTAAKTISSTHHYDDNGGATTEGRAIVFAGETVIRLYKTGSAVWANSVNLTTTRGSVMFEIQ
jgi:hypothetical protein